jgi:hypothetical protein
MSLESDIITAVMDSRKPEYNNDNVTLSTVLDFKNKHDIDALKNEVSRRCNVNHYAPPQSYEEIKTVNDLLSLVRSQIN